MPTTTTLRVSGPLPFGVLFHDNGDGTGYLGGVPQPGTVGVYHLTLTASNGVAPNATQPCVLTIARPTDVPLPRTVPASNGTLAGVPGLTTAGQLITVTGSGYAAGASITIGSYAGPVTPGHTVAGPTGSFSITVRVPAKGAHTLVATGIGGNGRARYLEARTTTR